MENKLENYNNNTQHDRTTDLYNFLLAKALIDQDHWVTHEEICEALPEHFTINHKAVNKECCSRIQMTILRINEMDFEKIVIYKNQTYKIAKNQKEVNDFIKRVFNAKYKRMNERLKTIQSKKVLDGQIILLNEDTETLKNCVKTYFSSSRLNESA